MKTLQASLKKKHPAKEEQRKNTQVQAGDCISYVLHLNVCVESGGVKPKATFNENWKTTFFFSDRLGPFLATIQPTWNPFHLPPNLSRYGDDHEDDRSDDHEDIHEDDRSD